MTIADRPMRRGGTRGPEGRCGPVRGRSGPRPSPPPRTWGPFHRGVTGFQATGRRRAERSGRGGAARMRRLAGRRRPVRPRRGRQPPAAGEGAASGPLRLWFRRTLAGLALRCGLVWFGFVFSSHTSSGHLCGPFETQREDETVSPNFAPARRSECCRDGVSPPSRQSPGETRRRCLVPVPHTHLCAHTSCIYLFAILFVYFKQFPRLAAGYFAWLCGGGCRCGGGRQAGVPTNGRRGAAEGGEGRGLEPGAAPGPGTGATGRGRPVGAAGWPSATAPGGQRRPRHGPARELPVGAAAGLAAGR